LGQILTPKNKLFFSKKGFPHKKGNFLGGGYIFLTGEKSGGKKFFFIIGGVFSHKQSCGVVKTQDTNFLQRFFLPHKERFFEEIFGGGKIFYPFFSSHHQEFLIPRCWAPYFWGENFHPNFWGGI